MSGQTPQATLARASAEAFGCTATFDAELRKLGQISPQEFARLYPVPADYLPQVAWDPTRARFWDLFDRDLERWYEANLLDLLRQRLDWTAGDFRNSRDLTRLLELLDKSAQSLRAYHDELGRVRKAGTEKTAWPQELWDRHQEIDQQARQHGLKAPLLSLICCCCGFRVERLRSLQRVRLQTTSDLLGWLLEPELEILLGVRGERLTDLRKRKFSSTEELVRWLRLQERQRMYAFLTGKAGFYADFRLTEPELANLRRNGFVVSERLGSFSCGELFYRLYSHDLPVFISTDSLLHAWHRSYETALEELEESCLSPFLGEILDDMAASLPDAGQKYGEGVLAQSLADADYFLSVARSLLAGKFMPPSLGRDESVAQNLQACESLQLLELPLFGRSRRIDFSQFKPRGRYERSVLLQRYFRAMMWCGKIDLCIAGDPTQSSPREWGTAIVLLDLLRRAARLDQWQQLDQLLRTFTGPTDSLTFPMLAELLGRAEIRSPQDIECLETLTTLQAGILAGGSGVQHIRSHYTESWPFGPEKASLPRSFTFLGQRFALDSWALSKVVYDDIVWNGEKVPRRVPSCLDVAFAALGNNQVVPELVSRMAAENGHPNRDGLNYQHNLAAARNTIDAMNPTVWGESLYAMWLSCLRELSLPTTDAKYPSTMRTRTWAMKTLNTQLVSWTQLRHANVLYVKQSYTGGSLCEHPAGYVEPLPRFWECLEGMARRAAEAVEQTPFPDRQIERKPVEEWMRQHLEQSAEEGRAAMLEAGGWMVNPRHAQQRQAVFFREFADTVAVLRGIAEKELARQELTPEEKRFLKDVIQIQDESGGPYYNGWYPKLFYREPKDCGRLDALVCDVHTNVPDRVTGDPGSVLHQAVGKADLLLLGVDHGDGPVLYAGPVLSHYEFEADGLNRQSDSEWEREVWKAKLPPRPPWTKDYLIAEGAASAGQYFDPADWDDVDTDD